MRVRLGIILTLLIFGAVCLALAAPTRAAVRQADDPIVDRATRTMIDDLPGSGTDLPLFLSGPRDVYLFVTAGAAYTDVRVLADLSVNPETLARALDTAAAGTPLAGTTVEWSTDRYAAAHLAAKATHWGRESAVNTVPVGALIAGLRRAGFVPHPLLRVPRYAVTAGLPPVTTGTLHYRWYDGHALTRSGPIQVSAALSPEDLWPFALLLVPAFLSLLGLGLAVRVAGDERRSLAQRRRWFQSLVNLPLFTLVFSMPVLVFFLQSTGIATASDLWFGSAKPSTLVLPIILLMTLPTVPLLSNRAKIIRYSAFG